MVLILRNFVDIVYSVHDMEDDFFYIKIIYINECVTALIRILAKGVILEHRIKSSPRNLTVFINI